jgi:hypothetical protein
MNIEILSNVPKKFETIFRNEIENIHPAIKAMIKRRNMSFKLVDCITDLLEKERTEKIETTYKYNLDLKNQSRGLMSDESHCIAVSVKNTYIDNIGAILYHEIGHFLDAYENYGNIKNLYDLTLSADKRFIEAYIKDFTEHYEFIKNDNNFRLKHFIQDSTLENINQNAVCETFAELYRFANNKKNDTKTVELYFPTALNILKILLKEKYNIMV